MTYVQNPLVKWLLAHSYGQGGSVAEPTAYDPSAFVGPLGEFPAGIEDVLKHVRERLNQSNATRNNEVDWCFFVGGPGNGKSEALRALARELGYRLPKRVVGKAVPRAVPEVWLQHPHVVRASSVAVAFINDASIPRPRKDDQEPGSLHQDASEAFWYCAANGPFALFANVNRGILVEEAGAIRNAHPSLNTSEGRLAAELIRWLARSPSEDKRTTLGTLVPIVEIDSAAPYYAQCKIEVRPDLHVIVHAVFLDTLSLLEPRPGGGGLKPAVDFTHNPPAVAKYQTFGFLKSAAQGSGTRDETTAGSLIRDFSDPKRWKTGLCTDTKTGELCALHAKCPFAQNARWLAADTLRQRFLDALRGAEVAAGRRFTYRDLLGHISLALLGQPEEDWLDQTHPCQWVQGQQNAHSRQASATLQAHRIYANLFGNVFSDTKRFSEESTAGDSIYRSVKERRLAIGEAPRIQAFERAFQDIDPARDTDGWEGNRVKALDAVESLDYAAPWKEMEGILPDGAQSDIEKEFDKILQDEIGEELTDGYQTSINRARALRRWRGLLMLRQVGLALGYVGFAEAIEAWLQEHQNALQDGSPGALAEGLEHLIVPERDNSGHACIAPFRPRTFCLSELPAKSLLVAIQKSAIQLMLTASGDTLMAEVKMLSPRGRQEPHALATFVIDLAICREAMLHKGGEASSFTEIGSTAFARIERARASLVSRKLLRRTPLQFTDDNKELSRIVTNPTGSVRLRIQKD